MTKIDQINAEFYNTYADSFDKIPFEPILTALVTQYFKKAAGDVLEIGSGAGAFALWLKDRGCNVTCLEPAEKPAAIARSKGLEVVLNRYQDYTTDKKFDLIAAISSLIHIPKNEIGPLIKKIHNSLKPEGLFIASFIEGASEGFEDPTGKGKDRYFSKYSFSELEALIGPHFSVLHTEKVEVRKMDQSFFIIVSTPITVK